jgi:molecular chaperone DnaK (HSP70)
MWVHVQPKISLVEYSDKLNEITEQCNKYIEQPPISLSQITTKDELVTLCESLKSSVLSNTLSIDEQNIGILDDKVDETLKWLNEHNEATSEQYQERIDILNETCNKIYESLTGKN